MRSVLAVARRELQVTLRAPIVYVVGGLFLVVQGIAFAGLIGAMSDPRRPAPLGAVLEGQLSGTLLTWVLELVVLTLLGMRAVADERRTGGWELLLTARVGEGAAVVGKWLAATAVYALLWLPTLAYFVVVAAYRSDAGGWDWASIATGYAGAIASGAALLAWAIAASSATSTPLAAGGLGFAVLIGLFLIGEVGSVWPGLADDHRAIADALDTVSLRHTAQGFARGEVTLAAVVRLAGLGATGLSLAIALACAGRRRTTEVRARVASTGLVAVIAVLASIAAARHPARWDVSADRRSTLDAGTREVLAGLPERGSIVIVQPTIAGLQSVYDEVAHVADRMAEVAPIDVTRIDPADLPGGVAAAAREGGVAADDLSSNGGVIVELGGRRIVVDRVSLVTYDPDDAGGPSFGRLEIEQAIAGAFAQLASRAPVFACVTTGHGELSTEGRTDGKDWRLAAERLRADGMTVQDVTLETGVPERCDVVLVAGPTLPFDDKEQLALDRFVARGGGLLVAAAGRPPPVGGLADTGLDGVLATAGLGLPKAMAVDPALAIAQLPGALLVTNGYTDHEIDRGFAGSRATVWYPPRVVVTADGQAVPLVSSTAGCYGERSVDVSPPVRDPDDLAGPCVLAAASTKRHVVAVGAAESFTSILVGGGASAADLWLAHAVRWLAGKPAPVVDISSRAPAEVRLVMTSSERSAAIAVVVGVIPLVWIAVGGLVVLWRRRRAAA